MSADGKRRVHEDLLVGLHPCRDTAELIARAITDEPAADSVIRPGFSEELDALRSTARDARQFLADLERRERERTGIDSLKVSYNRVHGYYIEISKAKGGEVPDDYVRRQTLKSAERYITPELKEYEEKVLTADEKAKELEYELFLELRDAVAASRGRMQATAAVLAQIDVLTALAELARGRNYGRPEMVVPVFMNVWAGSWLMASVTIEWMMQISSAMPPMCGNSVQISCWLLPYLANGCCGAKQLSFLPCSWAIGWPLVSDSGIGLPCISASFGL